MSSLARVFACMLAAWLFGFFGLILMAIFLPLLFPLSFPTGEPQNQAYIWAALFLTACAVAGVVLCWKITARWQK
jgi:hypothetical protein